MPDKDKDSSVDLGLSSLLDGAAEPAPAPPPMADASAEPSELFGDILSQEAREQPPSTASELSCESNEPVAVDDDPLEKLAQSGEWKKISETVEPILTDAGDTNRLWWILSQMHLGELPATVLCAPFDDYVTGLLARDDFDKVKGQVHSRLVEAVMGLADKLEASKETDLCIAILERVYRVSRDSKIALRLSHLVQTSLEELPRRVTFHTPSEMKKRLHLLDLKRELESEKGEVFTLKEEVSDFDEVLISQSKIVEGGGSRRALFLLLGLFGLLLGVWSLFRLEYFSSGIQSHVAGGVSETGVQAPSGEVPKAARITDVSQLAALAYDVERKDAAAEQLPQPATTTVAAPTQSVVAKAQIQMDGPYETDKIREIREGGSLGSSRYDDAPEGARDITQEDRRQDDSLERRDAVRRPPARELERPYSDNRHRPGRWEGGERYEVMINTSVMERPSFHAREVAELHAGDRVLVDARVGRWLKIRSVKGAPGYIMAQDAEKLYD